MNIQQQYEATQTYEYILDFYQKNYCVPTIDDIAEVLECSRSTARLKIKGLIADSFLLDRKGRRPAYIINWELLK